MLYDVPQPTTATLSPGRGSTLLLTVLANDAAGGPTARLAGDLRHEGHGVVPLATTSADAAVTGASVREVACTIPEVYMSPQSAPLY